MAKAVADYVFLYELLMDKNIENQTLETVSNIVQKKFGKSDFLSVGTLLTALIRNGDLPGIIQKISAYYVIYDLFKGDGQNETPFLTVFLHVIEQKELISKVNVIEKNFVAQLLSPGGTKELAKQTPGQILTQDIMKLNADFTALKVQNYERQKELPTTVKSSLMNIVPAPSSTPSDNSILEMMEGYVKNETPQKSIFTPQFMTIAPPLLEVEDELVWFDFTNPAWHKPMYDTTISSPNIVNSDAKRLIALAFNEALNIQDRQLLLAELEKDPNIVYHIGLTPAKLPDLVENNPLVAIEILLKLMHSTQITEYFNVLVNMEMSLYSMEVVNRLTTSVDLPTEFVYLYISNCISTCETIKDKYVQTRLVRLLCVFLQSLIRNKIINVKELFIEVEAFCVEFSRIREAAGLYRLLKQLEIGEPAVSTTPTKSKE
ncbi:CCR4-NOT transcription complex subunit 11 [Bradysia coprophila]|uniref:CCR4-NOT transcription complex subunit 11 n=1 Tax=Bradysia coprophila TaxID=38358 RepID=UPI00187DAEAF|nr:CCR4-NOT transcription complex subunit 11 [Bradysia coprophila]